MSYRGSKKKWYDSLFVIIGIVLLILSVGLIFSSDKSENSKQLDEGEEDPRIKMKERLGFVKEQIELLEPRKNKLKNREFWLLLATRLSVGIIIVFLNYFFYDLYNSEESKITWQVAFNNALILIYTFIGFIRYGSIQKFREWMSKSFVALVTKRHMHVKKELDAFYSEKKDLVEQIDLLDRQLG